MTPAEEDTFNEMIRVANRVDKAGNEGIAATIRRWADQFREMAASRHNLLNSVPGLRAQIADLIMQLHVPVGQGVHAQCRECKVPYPCAERQSVWS